MTTSPPAKQRLTHGRIGNIPRHRLPNRPGRSTAPDYPPVLEQIVNESAEIQFRAVHAAMLVRLFCVGKVRETSHVTWAMGFVLEHGIRISRRSEAEILRHLNRRVVAANSMAEKFSGGIRAGEREIAKLNRKIAKLRDDISNFENSRLQEEKYAEQLQSTTDKWSELISSTPIEGTRNAP